MIIKRFGYVESYIDLKKLSPGAFDIVQVDRQKESPGAEVLDLRALDKKESSVPLLQPNGGIFIWDKNAEDSEDEHDIFSPGEGTLADPSPSRGRWKRLLENLSVKWFGAKGDMNQHYIDKDGIVTRYRGTITPGSEELQLTSESDIDRKDEGKTIVVWTPGLKDGYFVSKIKEVKLDGLKSVVLEDIPKVTITGGYVAWGTDDTDAIQNAIDIAERTGLAVYLSPGHYIVTKTLSYTTFEPRRHLTDAGRYWPNSPYRLMMPGLRMYGAGLQATFVHSLIENDKDSATIKLDGTGAIKSNKTWQQTGHLKDFSIRSIGYFESTPSTKGIETKGIDFVSTWAYTIENVAIMNMGSDGINVRNLDVDLGSSDWDQTDKLRLDNVFVFASHGWGIKVDAAEGAASTTKIHIDRCKIEENKSGGIQWTGQGGTIERCGIYGNGTDHSPEKETYGILVKNVKATSNGLLITGCEIQDNANVQVMIAVGGNIRIVQNDFKVEYTEHWFWPKVDVQVGDGNIGDLYFDLDKAMKTSKTLSSGSMVTINQPTDTVLEFTGTGTTTPVVTPVVVLSTVVPPESTLNWLILNNTEMTVSLEPHAVSAINLPPHSRRLVFKDSTGVKVRQPRTVNSCVIQDNRIRGSYRIPKDGESEDHWSDLAPEHTVVKVNTNAVGTVISRWWSQYKEDTKHKLLELADNVTPKAGKRTLNVMDIIYGRVHAKTHLIRDDISGGHVLLPFASTNVPVNETQINHTGDQVNYPPDTSRWSSYYFDIRDIKAKDPPNTPANELTRRVVSLYLENPTTRTSSSPLFLQFVNSCNIVPRDILVSFDSEYNVGKSIIIPHGKTVTGILMLAESGEWTSFSPWTCEGKPL